MDSEPLDIDELDFWEQAYLVALGAALSRDNMVETVDGAGDIATEAADRAVRDRRDRFKFLEKE